MAVAEESGLEARLTAVRAHLSQPIQEILPPRLLLYLVPPLPSWRYMLAVILLGVALLARIYTILPGRQNRQTAGARRDEVKVAVFLGSGGHTTELLQLVSALPLERYSQRVYMLSSGDNFSLRKAQELECKTIPNSQKQLSILQIPRARKVHQSLLSTPFTLLYSIVFCIYHIAFRPFVEALAKYGSFQRAGFADVVMMNGPGTCVPIVVAIYVLRIMGLKSPKIIYVESFARVKSFSLTAKLVRPFVDRFVTQWPSAQPLGGNQIHPGWLI